MIGALLLSVVIGPMPSLEARLRRELAGLPGIGFKDEEGTLVVRYHTERVLTPGGSKSRQPVKRMVWQEIPGLTGFKLETYEFAHKPTDPPRAMQAVQVGPAGHDEGKWRLAFQDLQIDGADRARYYNLAWGAKADPRLLSKVRRILAEGAHPINERG